MEKKTSWFLKIVRKNLGVEKKQKGGLMEGFKFIYIIYLKPCPYILTLDKTFNTLCVDFSSGSTVHAKLWLSLHMNKIFNFFLLTFAWTFDSFIFMMIGLHSFKIGGWGCLLFDQVLEDFI